MFYHGNREQTRTESGARVGYCCGTPDHVLGRVVEVPECSELRVLNGMQMEAWI